MGNVGEGIYSVTITNANGCSDFFDQLTIGNDCVVSIIQQKQSAISSAVYQVAQFIQSNGMIDANKQVSFKAGDYIELFNDFEVTIDAEFEARIEGCQ